MRPAGRSPRIPIFVTVLSLFVLAALLLATALTITNFIETRRTAIKVAAETFRATIDRINERRWRRTSPGERCRMGFASLYPSYVLRASPGVSVALLSSRA